MSEGGALVKTDEGRSGISPFTTVTLGFMVVVLSSVATGAAMAGSYGTRVDTLERDTAKLEKSLDDVSRELRLTREEMQALRITLAQQQATTDALRDGRAGRR